MTPDTKRLARFAGAGDEAAAAELWRLERRAGSSWLAQVLALPLGSQHRKVRLEPPDGGPPRVSLCTQDWGNPAQWRAGRTLRAHPSDVRAVERGVRDAHRVLEWWRRGPQPHRGPGWVRWPEHGSREIAWDVLWSAVRAGRGTARDVAVHEASVRALVEDAPRGAVEAAMRTLAHGEWAYGTWPATPPRCRRHPAEIRREEIQVERVPGSGLAVIRLPGELITTAHDVETVEGWLAHTVDPDHLRQLAQAAPGSRDARLLTQLLEGDWGDIEADVAGLRQEILARGEGRPEVWYLATRGYLRRRRQSARDDAPLSVALLVDQIAASYGHECGRIGLGLDGPTSAAAFVAEQRRYVDVLRDLYDGDALPGIRSWAAQDEPPCCSLPSCLATPSGVARTDVLSHVTGSGRAEWTAWASAPGAPLDRLRLDIEAGPGPDHWPAPTGVRGGRPICSVLLPHDVDSNTWGVEAEVHDALLVRGRWDRLAPLDVLDRILPEDLSDRLATELAARGIDPDTRMVDGWQRYEDLAEAHGW